MAETRVINLEVQDNTKSLKAQLKEAQAEVQTLADKYGATSKEAVEAAKRAAELKDRIGDAKALTDAFNPDAKFKALSGSLTGVAGGFSAVTGAMGLLGTESEDVQRMMLKVQSAMALSQGLQALGESRDAFKQLGAVAVNALKGIKSGIASTGIGVLLVAVGTLVAYWDDIKDAMSGVSDEQEKLNQKTKANYEVQQKKLDNLGSQDNILKLQGKTERQILAIKVKQTDETIKALEISIAQSEATLKSQVEATKRNQNILKTIFRVSREMATAGLRLLAAPIDAVLATANAVSEQLGFGKITTFSINAEITKLNKSTSEWASRQFFDPASTKADGEKTINEQRATLNKLKNDRAGMLLQIQELDKKAAEKGKKDAGDAAKQASEARKKLIDELKKQYEDELKLNEETENQKLALMQDGIEKEKALRQDQFNEFRDNFLLERIKEEEDALNKQFEAGKISQTQYFKQLEALRLNAETKLTEKEKEVLTNARELLNKDLLKIDEKYEAEKRKLEEDALKTAQDLEKKRRQEFDAQIEALDEENYQAKLTDQQREIGAIRDKYFALEEAAKGNADAEKTIAEAKGREIDAINKKYAEEEEKRRKEAIARNLDIAQSGLSAIQSLTELFGKKGEKEARRAFNVKKAAQIASATIDTYKNAVAAYGSQFVPVPDPSSPVRGGIAAGIAVSAGLINIAKIASQKFEGGGANGGGGGVTGVGGIGAGGAMAPQFNVVGNNNINQLAQLQQQPIKAYVVGAEVTTQQALDRNRISTGQL